MSDTSEVLSQSDVAVYAIKQMIIDGRLRPGEKLPIEKDLAPELGVSRSSLREGVRALALMGVLETRRGAGMYVTSLDASLLTQPMGFIVDLQHDSGARQLHAVRRILESEAAALAAQAMSPEDIARAEAILELANEIVAADDVDHQAVIDLDLEFHRLIAQASENHVLAALIEALAGRTVRGRLWRGIIDEGADRRTVAEHSGILRAIMDRSSDYARTRMAAHLIAVEEFLVDSPVEDRHPLGQATLTSARSAQ